MANRLILPPPNNIVSRQALDDYIGLRHQWRNNAVLYAKTRIGINPTKQQQSLLEAVTPMGARVSTRAAHGVGKTTGASIAMWWQLECFDNCKIPCTAPTANQLRSVLWAELAKTLSRSDEQSTKLKLPRRFWLSSLFKINQDTIFDSTVVKGRYIARDKRCAIARTARKGESSSMQGFHASDLIITEDDIAVDRNPDGSSGALMIVIEEASGVSDDIFEVFEGALSSANTRLLMIGNPVSNTGFFEESHQKNKDSYTTLHFPCSGSPLPAKDYRDKLVRKYGEGSNVVRVRADGEFPKQDDDVLIPLELVEVALKRQDYSIRQGRIVMGVDVARFGDDRTTFVIRQDNVIIYIEVNAKQDTMMTAGRVIHLARIYNVDAIHVDVIGLGAGVVDRLNEQRNEFKATVVGVNAADSATLTPLSRDKKTNRTPDDKFGKQDMIPNRMRDYLWLAMFSWFRDDAPILLCEGQDWKDHAEDLAAECASVKYSFESNGRMRVEEKVDMKKRGLRSPDLADGLGLTFSPNRVIIWERL